MNLSLSATHFSTTPYHKKNPVALYINRKNNPVNARTKSREKEKKALLVM